MPIFEQQIYNLKTGVHSMQSYLKTRPVWVQVFFLFGLCFGIFMIFNLIGLTILTKITGLKLTEIQGMFNLTEIDPRFKLFNRGMLLVQFFGLFLIPSLLFGYFTDPQPGKYLGLKNPEKFSYYLVAVAIMFFSLPLVEWMGNLNRNLPLPENINNWIKEGEEQARKLLGLMLTKQSVSDLILNIIFIAGFAAIGEELLFRGIIQRLVIKVSKNPITGIIITAILFSAIHMQFYGFIPRFFLGMLLGMIYWYSGSLWVAMVAHFVYDAFWIILSYFNPSVLLDESSSMFTYTGFVLPVLVSFTAVVILVWWMKKKSTVTYENIYAEDESEKDHTNDSN